MSVVLDEQTDTVVLEGLDFDLQCAAPTDHVADVMLITRCCRKETLLCAHHLAIVRFECDSRDASKCKRCGHLSFSFDEAAEVVPL